LATKAQQETLLGEGLAIGCFAAGIESLPNDTSFDLDFRHAWRGWPWASQFPQVHAGPVNDSIERILRQSANRRGPVLAWWTEEGGHRPVLAFDWDLDEYFEELESRSDGKIPRHAWGDLARRVFEARGRYRATASS